MPGHEKMRPSYILTRRGRVKHIAPWPLDIEKYIQNRLRPMVEAAYSHQAILKSAPPPPPVRTTAVNSSRIAAKSSSASTNRPKSLDNPLTNHPWIIGVLLMILFPILFTMLVVISHFKDQKTTGRQIGESRVVARTQGPPSTPREADDSLWQAYVFNCSGKAYLDANAPDKALEELDKAIASNPDYAAAYNNRGVAYHLKGQYRQALKEYYTAVELDKQLAEAYRNIGIIHEIEGNRLYAAKAYETYLKLKPDAIDRLELAAKIGLLQQIETSDVSEARPPEYQMRK